LCFVDTFPKSGAPTLSRLQSFLLISQLQSLLWFLRFLKFVRLSLSDYSETWFSVSTLCRFSAHPLELPFEQPLFFNLLRHFRDFYSESFSRFLSFLTRFNHC